MQILIWGGVLLVSLFLIVKSADYFTEYSEKLGIALGLSSFIIGASIVAIGTSLPELVSSLFAVLDAGATEFVTDNIIGSNIANALLILGIGALFAKKSTLAVETSLISVDLPFFFASMALFAYFLIDKNITFFEGIFLLIFFLVFLVYTIKSQSKETEEEDKEEMQDLEDKFQKEEGITKRMVSKTKNIFTHHEVPYAKYILIILLSMGSLAFSAKYLIESLMNLSSVLGVSSSLLTVTIVAVGTSLPEVLTSVAAIRRGNHGIALGNVFGSNTFNLLLVGGLPALFSTLTVSDLTYLVGLPYLVVATFIAIFVTFDNKVVRWEGVSLLFLYLVFIAKVVGII
ncbi:MAG: calcium/sodium antiporter [Patescibacteria group bacterium]